MKKSPTEIYRDISTDDFQLIESARKIIRLLSKLDAIKHSDISDWMLLDEQGLCSVCYYEHDACDCFNLDEHTRDEEWSTYAPEYDDEAAYI